MDTKIPEIDELKIKENIEKYSSEKLIEMIVAHRYLHLFEGSCILAMHELARRRSIGDELPFEKMIEEKLAALPKLEFAKSLNFNSLIQMFGKKK